MNSDLFLAVRRDWQIFPLLHSSRLATAQPLLLHATSIETEIERWENRYPDCAWAVATGSESGIFALAFSLDVGSASLRLFGERDPDLSRTLQVRGPNELLAFLEWPAVGLSPWTPSMIAPGVRLREEGNHVPIPGPGMTIHRYYEYVDREAPALPPSEWLMDLLHADNNGRGASRMFACRPSGL